MADASLLSMLSGGALPLAVGLYLLTALGWPTWRIWRRTGVNPVVLSRADDAHGMVSRSFGLVLLALVVFSVAWAAWPAGMAKLGRIEALDAAWVAGLGWTAVAVCWLWTVMAQLQMGASWRVGIDTQRTTDLVQHGLFARSRNPIFLGMRLTLAGTFLIAPHAVSLAVWVCGELLMQIQVRLEEVHLQALHGERYRAYQQRTPRWI